MKAQVNGVPRCADPTPESVAINTLYTLWLAWGTDGAALIDCYAQALRLWHFVAGPAEIGRAHV